MSDTEQDNGWEKVPTHVAIIMDGNGRWAKSRGLPRIAGHRAGTENLRQIIEACVEFGVKCLTIYAFSTENWGRPQTEISGLMSIFADVIDRELSELHSQGVQLRHIGRLDRIKPALRKKVLSAIDLTKNNDRLIVNVAFNYGGRDEIVYAVQSMLGEGLKPEDVTPETIDKYLFTAGIPDPDLVIRTSGEQRGSNFMIWQAAYAEWYFPTVYWPDFDKEQLRAALDEYAKRSRRFGLASNPT